VVDAFVVVELDDVASCLCAADPEVDGSRVLLLCPVTVSTTTKAATTNSNPTSIRPNDVLVLVRDLTTGPLSADSDGAVAAEECSVHPAPSQYRRSDWLVGSGYHPAGLQLQYVLKEKTEMLVR